MNQNQTSVPRLDLAPKLSRPLTLWNPLDYLRLLYWSLFFPQALRFYIENFANKFIPEGRINWSKTWKWLRQNHIPRHLFVQGLVLILFTWLFIGLSLRVGLWLANTALSCLILTIFIGSVCAGAVGQKHDVALGVASGVASGIASGVVSGPLLILIVLSGIPIKVGSSVAGIVAGFLGSQIATNLENGVLFGIWLGLVWGIGWGVGLGVLSGVAFGVLNTPWFGFSLGILVCILSSLILGWASGIVLGIGFGLSFGITSGLAILRIGNWIFYLPFSLRFPGNGYWQLPCVTPIPIPYIYNHLTNWLRQDWETGLHNANEIVTYTLQFIPVVQAINQVLSELPPEQLVFKLAQLSDSCLDKRLVRFASEKLSLLSNANEFKLRLDSPVHAAAAGFWYLQLCPKRLQFNEIVLRDPYDNNLSKAMEAFSIVDFLPYAEEMLAITRFLAAFSDAVDIVDIAFIEIPTYPTEKQLRPITWEAIDFLCQVVRDVKAFQSSISHAARLVSLNRALEKLNNLLNQADTLPKTERWRIVYIANNWRQALLNVASKLQVISINQPVRNPYVAGAPIQGKLFVGRGDILKQLEEFWILAQQLQSVILYGHRRMGKSSILRNIAQCLGSEIKVAYINLLGLGDSTDGVGEVLMAISDAISEAVNLPPPSDNELLNLPYRTFERYLKRVETNLDNGLIIALDEFEKIEELINKGKIHNNFMGYLRSLVQMSPKIAFAFAGLHTLEEMTEDYFQPFFASVIPIKVSFLEPAPSYQLLENPTENFVLGYKSEALKEIYDLTAGQPYLIQLMGFLLVNHFNNQVFEQGLSREPIFTVQDVEEVIKDPEFFKRGRYYFTGVWGQAVQGVSGQQTILRSIAPYPEGLTINAIAQSTAIDEATVEEALNTLKRHDVVKETEGRWHIIVELFRRWVLDL